MCEKRLTFLYTSPCEYVQYNVRGPYSPLAEGGPVCIFRSPKFLLKFV